MNRIVQLSDLHITPKKGRAWGTDVWQGLQQTLAALPRFEPFGHLILSGDLANMPRQRAYDQLADAMRPYEDRLWVLPGNHDGRAKLAKSFRARMQSTDHCRFMTRAGSWKLIGLDSKRAWRVHGRIGPAQRKWLRSELEEDRPTALFLHHPVQPVGTWWLDKDVIRDAAELADIVQDSPVRAIFCGHVHQEYAGTAAGVPFHACPSTAYQFLPGSKRPGAVESRAPAFRVIDFDDENFSTQVVRLPLPAL